MPGNIVVDSSVIAAVFFLEDATEQAISCVQNRECITVDLAFAEVANVAWKRQSFFRHDPASVKPALDAALAFIGETCEVLSSRDLAGDAFACAGESAITVYDALYVAAADQQKVPLFTLDGELFARTHESHAVRHITPGKDI